MKASLIKSSKLCIAVLSFMLLYPSISITQAAPATPSLRIREVSVSTQKTFDKQLRTVSDSLSKIDKLLSGMEKNKTFNPDKVKQIESGIDASAAALEQAIKLAENNPQMIKQLKNNAIKFDKQSIQLEKRSDKLIVKLQNGRMKLNNSYMKKMGPAEKKELMKFIKPGARENFKLLNPRLVLNDLPMELAPNEERKNFASSTTIDDRSILHKMADSVTEWMIPSAEASWISCTVGCSKTYYRCRRNCSGWWWKKYKCRWKCLRNFFRCIKNC